GDWWLYVALDYALGHPTDRKLTAWDEMFIPMRMRERLNQLKIKDEAGNELPLVKSEELVHQSARAPQREKPPFWVPWFFLVGIMMGGAIASCAIAMLRIDVRWK